MEIYIEIIKTLLTSTIFAFIAYKCGIKMNKQQSYVTINPLIYSLIAFMFGMPGFLIYSGVMIYKINKAEKNEGVKKHDK